MFKDSYVTDAAKNTLLYVVMTVPVQTILHWHLQLFWQQRYRIKKVNSYEVLCLFRLSHLQLPQVQYGESS